MLAAYTRSILVKNKIAGCGISSENNIASAEIKCLAGKLSLDALEYRTSLSLRRCRLLGSCLSLNSCSCCGRSSGNCRLLGISLSDRPLLSSIRINAGLRLGNCTHACCRACNCSCCCRLLAGRDYQHYESADEEENTYCDK